MPKIIYNEGRVVGYSAYEIYVQQAIANGVKPQEIAAEKDWLASAIGIGASLLLKVPQESNTTPDGPHYIEYTLPNDSQLCAANTIIGSYFDGVGSTSDETSNWMQVVKDYGPLLPNNNTVHPSASSLSDPVESDMPVSEIRLNQLKSYMKIIDGVVIQPGKWSDNEYSNGPKMGFTPDLITDAQPIVRILVSKRIESDFYLILTGFTLESVVAGISSSGDNVSSADPEGIGNQPENGDFLGPKLYPWANKIVFSVPPSYINQLMDNTYKRKLPGDESSESVEAYPIVDIPDTEFDNAYSYFKDYPDVDSRLTVNVTDKNPNKDAAVLTVYQRDVELPPALYASVITKTGDATLYPVDTIAPGTVKLLSDEFFATLDMYSDIPGVSVLIRNENNAIYQFVVVDSKKEYIPVADVGNYMSLDTSGVQETWQPYIAKIQTGNNVVSALSMADSLTDEPYPLSGDSGEISSYKLSWSNIISALQNNKTINLHGKYARKLPSTAQSKQVTCYPVIDMQNVNPGTYYTTKYPDTRIPIAVTDKTPDVDAAVLTIHQKSTNLPPALYGTKVQSASKSGDTAHLNPIDVVAPGTVKLYCGDDASSEAESLEKNLPNNYSLVRHASYVLNQLDKSDPDDLISVPVASTTIEDSNTLQIYNSRYIWPFKHLNGEDSSDPYPNDLSKVNSILVNRVVCGYVSEEFIETYGLSSSQVQSCLTKLQSGSITATMYNQIPESEKDNYVYALMGGFQSITIPSQQYFFIPIDKVTRYINIMIPQSVKMMKGGQQHYVNCSVNTSLNYLGSWFNGTIQDGKIHYGALQAHPSAATDIPNVIAVYQPNAAVPLYDQSRYTCYVDWFSDVNVNNFLSAKPSTLGMSSNYNRCSVLEFLMYAAYRDLAYDLTSTSDDSYIASNLKFTRYFYTKSDILDVEANGTLVASTKIFGELSKTSFYAPGKLSFKQLDSSGSELSDVTADYTDIANRVWSTVMQTGHNVSHSISLLDGNGNPLRRGGSSGDIQTNKLNWDVLLKALSSDMSIDLVGPTLRSIIPAIPALTNLVSAINQMQPGDHYMLNVNGDGDFIVSPYTPQKYGFEVYTFTGSGLGSSTARWYNSCRLTIFKYQDSSATINTFGTFTQTARESAQLSSNTANWFQVFQADIDNSEFKALFNALKNPSALKIEITPRVSYVSSGTDAGAPTNNTSVVMTAYIRKQDGRIICYNRNNGSVAFPASGTYQCAVHSVSTSSVDWHDSDNYGVW